MLIKVSILSYDKNDLPTSKWKCVLFLFARFYELFDLLPQSLVFHTGKGVGKVDGISYEDNRLLNDYLFDVDDGSGALVTGLEVFLNLFARLIDKGRNIVKLRILG